MVQKNPIMYAYSTNHSDIIIKYDAFEQKDGSWIIKQYYSSGEKLLRGRVNKKGKQGLWFEFYRNGTVALACNYKDNILDGEFTAYHPEGTTQRFVRFVNGLEESKEIMFWKNGCQRSIGTFTHGKRNGLWRFFNADGGWLQEQGRFKENKRIGKWTWYNPDGTVQQTKDLGEQ